MILYKEFDNGLKLIVKKMNGLLSVSTGVFVKCGSANESAEENGISHFIEHAMFKGTKTRTAYDISNEIDSIGAQINAYTSKEMTCYYTKSTTEHFGKSLEILSDIFFNSTFLDKELDKERQVILQEIAMTGDDPEELTLDLLSESYYGNCGYGAPILGSAKNVKRFNREEVVKYITKYYVPKNIVISIAGNVDLDTVETKVKESFVDKFTNFGAENNAIIDTTPKRGNILVNKDIEQAHIAIAMPSCGFSSSRVNSASIVSTVFGGGMSSRLYQRIREQSGLAYSVFSFLSTYQTAGTMCIYAGVHPDKRDYAFDAIVQEIRNIYENGLSEKEFESGREQVKSSFIMSQESTATQMQLYGRYLLKNNVVFNFERKIADMNNLDVYDINREVKRNFCLEDCAVVSVGRNKEKLEIK